MSLLWSPKNLETWLISKWEGLANNDKGGDPKSLTIGIEHEFFLCDRQGSPASDTQSQSLLRVLSCHPGWYIRDQQNEGIEGKILKLSIEEADGKYSCIKYDHHPHLLEIAFSYHDSLQELEGRVKSILSMVESTANELGLVISQKSSLDISPMDPRIVSDLEIFKNLRFYRAKLLSENGSDPSERKNENYAAVIAATQTHIGGTNWWRYPHLVPNLYSHEADILYLITPSPRSNRWNGYSSVFKGYPLVGFPSLKDWSTSSWIEALFSSPLAGTVNDSWSANSISSIGHFPFDHSKEPWQSFLHCVRDLQIIRPKLFGTLEFRSDPSQNNSDLIMAVAALRLGLCAYRLLHNDQPTKSFPELASDWWSIALDRKPPKDRIYSATNTLEFARVGLSYRGKQEGVYLAPFESRLESRKPA